MATFRRNRIIESLSSAGSIVAFLLVVANLQLVATSVTWTAPPPQWTPANSKDIRTVNMSVVKGETQVALRWSYTLSAGSNLQTTTFYVIDGGNSDDIGSIFHGSNLTSVNDRNDYQTRFDISRSEVATLIINNVTEREEAVYGCKLTVVGNSWAYEIRVIVLVQSSITGDSGTQTGIEGSDVTLFCNVSGKPDPNVTWTMENGSDGKEVVFENPWVIKNISRNDTGTYRCTAYNGIGKEVSRLLYVNVTYPPKIVISRVKREREVAAQESVTLSCLAEGNPQPNYTWTPCDPQQSVCHESKLIIREVFKDINYTCRVENVLGSDTANTSVVIASDVINVTLVITSEECTDGENNKLWERLRTVIKVIFAGKMGYESVQQKNIRCGSAIVDLALKFNSTVRESEVLSILRNAVKTGGFGDLNVSAITGTRDTRITTTMATTPTSSSDSTTWIIVGVVLGIAFLLVVVGVVAWYVYRKRKCKKRDSKEVHNNGPQGEEGENVKNEGYVEVNSGYEGGNRSSVPPVVYDTAQTGNKRAAQVPPEYAVVDKSKRNPKKKKPGELQYAELAEFSAGQGGPRSSTSPTNRPTEIQYADVNAM